MQKSRRALLQRRASSNLDKINFVKKKYLYRVSLSVVFLLWIHVFLLNSLISHGNGSKDEQQESSFESISHENKPSNYDNTPEQNYANTPTSLDTNYQNTPDHETSFPQVELTITEPYKIKEERETNQEVERGTNQEESETNQELERQTNQEESETNQELERQTNQEEERETTQNVVRESNQEPEKETNQELEREINQELERETNQKEERERENASFQRPDRISRIAPLPLDEFKHKTLTNSKGKSVNNPQSSPGVATSLVHRLEPGGKEYNYASLSKGAKILSFNKEAKGASNILDKDKDKYLRNPCSVEGKFVILELSEETLVSTIEIANFEHYSSNLRDFEVFSSLVYPTEIWDKIGGFNANNTKHAQRFPLKEPKWARYLKFNFLSHYGNEFYCTLSSIEIYGVDAVERMLEDLISDEKSKNLISEEKVKISEDQIENIPPLQIQEPIENDSVEKEELKSEQKQDDISDEFEIDEENNNNGMNSNKILETRNNNVGRIQGDTALKVLLQKVQGLDLNFSVLERYLEELNNRYGEIFRDFDDDMVRKEKEIEKLRTEIKDLQMKKEILANEMGEMKDWKLLVSLQMEKLITDNKILRSEVEKVKERQKEVENKGLAVVFISFAFGSLAISKLFFEALLRIFRFSSDEKFYRTSSAWGFLLLSCSVISFIMVI